MNGKALHITPHYTLALWYEMWSYEIADQLASGKCRDSVVHYNHDCNVRLGGGIHVSVRYDTEPVVIIWIGDVISFKGITYIRFARRYVGC